MLCSILMFNGALLIGGQKFQKKSSNLKLPRKKCQYQKIHLRKVPKVEVQFQIVKSGSYVIQIVRSVNCSHMLLGTSVPRRFQRIFRSLGLCYADDFWLLVDVVPAFSSLSGQELAASRKSQYRLVLSGFPLRRRRNQDDDGLRELGTCCAILH